MNTISLSKSEVPTYLRSGEFFRSLSDDEDYEQQISIPSNTLKAEIIVNSNADLHHLLSSLRFWGVGSVQDGVIKYCLLELESPCADVLLEFAQDFPYVSALISVLSANPDEKVMMAVKSGILEIVRNLPGYLMVNVDCCSAAARAGNLEILQCLHERGGVLDSSVLHAALEGGDKSLACVQYLRTQSVEWPPSALVTALKAGGKECFYYALQDGCAWEDCEYFYLCGDQYVEALKYAIQHGYPVNIDSAVVAARAGAVQCLKVLHEVNCPWNKYACEAAAETGYLNCLQHLHENNCPWDEDTVYWAVYGNHIECLQYTLQQGCSVDTSCCTLAAIKGYLCVLQCLHEAGGALWNEETCTEVASNGHLDCLQYLHENGCPWDEDTVYYAVENNQIECVQYALQQGCSAKIDSCYNAAHKGYLSILQCLHEHGAPWDESTFRKTLESGQLECLKYLLENGCPIDMKECQEWIAQGKCQEAVDMVSSFHPHLLPYCSL